MFLMGHARPLFVYFRSFQTKVLQETAVGFSRIRTQIAGMEGELADHHHVPTQHQCSTHRELQKQTKGAWGWSKTEECTYLQTVAAA